MATRPVLRTIQVGTHTLKNRVGMAALTRNRAPSTYPTDLMKEYYVQRANAGLIVSEGILITRQGTEWPNAPGIWDEKHIAGWKNIVAGVHEAGSKINAQLWHRLWHFLCALQSFKMDLQLQLDPQLIRMRRSKNLLACLYMPHPPLPPGVENSASSPENRDTLHQLLSKILGPLSPSSSRQLSMRSKQASMELSFTAPAGTWLTNSSTAAGNVENRSRFGLEVLKALTEVFGRDVGVKLVPDGGFGDVGMPLQETLETYSYFISEDDKLNLAYICLMRYGPKMDFEYEAGVPRATKHDVVASYRHLIKNAKAFVNVDVTPEEGDPKARPMLYSSVSTGSRIPTL